VSWVGTLILAGLAGLNPWVVVVIVVGLATFTRNAALNAPYSQAANTVGLAVFAALLGIDVVVGKLRRAARFVEPVSFAAAATIGALLPLALLPAGQEDVVWVVLPGLAVAVAMRWVRQRSARRLDTWLRPFGHVAASMGADLLAGTLTAAVFAVKP
jgi:hypothetical protein